MGTYPLPAWESKRPEQIGVADIARPIKRIRTAGYPAAIERRLDRPRRGKDGRLCEVAISGALVCQLVRSLTLRTAGWLGRT